MQGSVAVVADAFIIDAYNLMPRLLPPAEAGLRSDAGRHALEARLRMFRNAWGPGTRIFLVYDGELGLPAPARREKGFEVYFSRPPRKADDVVLELARKHEGERGVHVVTSDFTDIAQPVRGLRVKHWSSQDFVDAYARKVASQRGGKSAEARPGGDASTDAAKPENLSSSEVDSWMRAFGFDSSGTGEEGDAEGKRRK